MRRQYATGLLIGRDLVQWATIASGNGRCALVSSASVPLPASASGVQGVTGEANALVAYLHEHASAFRGSLTVGLPSDSVLVRVVRLPTTDDAELAHMVELQCDKVSPFPLEQMAFSYEIIAREEAHTIVILAGSKVETLGHVLNLLDAVGTLPERVDAEPLARWQGLLDAGAIHPAGRQVCLVEDSGGVTLIVTEGRVPVSIRFFARAASATEETFHDEVVEGVRHTLLAVELERGHEASVRFTMWQENPSNEARLPTRLEAACGVSVAVRPLRDLPSVAEVLARRTVQAEGKGGLDLTPPDWRQNRHTRRVRRRLLAAAESAVAVWLIGVLGLVGAVLWETRCVERLRAEATRLRGPADEVRKIRDRVRHVKRCLDWRGSALECLREITRALPDRTSGGVDLISFSFRKGESVRVAGEAFPTVDCVYTFKTALDASELFASNTFVRAPTAISGRPRPTFSFEIELKPAELSP